MRHKCNKCDQRFETYDKEEEKYHEKYQCPKRKEIFGKKSKLFFKK